MASPSNSMEDATTGAAKESRLEYDIDENTVNVQNTDCSSSGKALAWEVEDADAPAVPEGYILAAESTFAINVDEFFSLFFSDESYPFSNSYHNKCRDEDLTCTAWKRHDQFGYIRDISFRHPIKIYDGGRLASCREVQNFRVYRNSHLVVKTSHVVINNNVPYGDYFCVEGLWDVVADSNNGCTLKIYMNVAFSKRTWMKGYIERALLEECRDLFAAFIELANVVLKQKNEYKEAPVRTLDELEMPCLQSNMKILTITESQPVSTSLKGYSSSSSNSFYKSLVVILLAVVILMQINITVLLF